ncbi:hypothetical protein [Rhizobium sp. CC-YZS058]|uniref:hypothetical protein n=1 Tax=Rhizobium sp. CC-YZS058 TaxID=3042153 RepID=UPI002B0546E2|nr:hypothetical protein [Rhizobium sp. CC-YZS058]MEA3536088.1 hypothetical protein [Rhizobium sp. CC-YZS058]
MSQSHDLSLFGLRQAPPRVGPARRAQVRDLIFGAPPAAGPTQVTGRSAAPFTFCLSSNRLLSQGK